jgi:hypothetical protein
MQLIVQAEGLPATHVEATRICRVKKWPHPGSVLPVEFHAEKPEKFDILWDQVPSWEEQARQQAAMLTQAINQGGAAPGMAFPAGNVQVVNLSGGPVDPEKMAAVERMVGMDLDGDGRVGGAAAGSTLPPPPGAPVAPVAPGFPPPPGDAGDRVSALERLAALRDRGVLTPTEFEIEKQRILSGGAG